MKESNVKNIRGRRSKGKAPKSMRQAVVAADLKNKDYVTEVKEGMRSRFVRLTLGMVTLVVSAFLLNTILFSQLVHMVQQSSLKSSYAEQLKAGTAPTGEIDFTGTVLAQGAPLAVIRIPSIGLNEVISEGTDSYTLRGGPGHRRDTVLPGQVGNSVVMGRASSYGGPFGKLQSLAPGDVFVVITGQGVQKFKVQGVRYARDYTLPSIAPGESRLTLLSARGVPYIPNGVIRLDAALVSQTQPAGPRVSTIINVPREDREFGFDSRFAWALFLSLQLLIAVQVCWIFGSRRFGVARTYLVLSPVALLSLILVMDQISRFLPNLL
jgi:hypothetical protein